MIETQYNRNIGLQKLHQALEVQRQARNTASAPFKSIDPRAAALDALRKSQGSGAQNSPALKRQYDLSSSRISQSATTVRVEENSKDQERKSADILWSVYNQQARTPTPQPIHKQVLGSLFDRVA